MVFKRMITGGTPKKLPHGKPMAVGHLEELSAAQEISAQSPTSRVVVGVTWAPVLRSHSPGPTNPPHLSQLGPWPWPVQ